MDRRIELVISKIKSETATAWDSTTLATLVNLSPSRFRHLFKQETGMGPAQYLKEYRLRKAEKMLRTTFLSVKEGLAPALRIRNSGGKPLFLTCSNHNSGTITHNSRFRQKLAVFDNKQSLT